MYIYIYINLYIYIYIYIYIPKNVRNSKKLVLWIRIKDIKGKFETIYPTEQQIKKYKRHGCMLMNAL